MVVAAIITASVGLCVLVPAGLRAWGVRHDKRQRERQREMKMMTARRRDGEA